MRGVLSAPRTMFLKLKPNTYSLFILLGMIINMLTNSALEVNQVVLGHSEN